jgi:hypothetical protein
MTTRSNGGALRGRCGDGISVIGAPEPGRWVSQSRFAKIL